MTFILSPHDIQEYRYGVSISELAQKRDVAPLTVRRALVRRGIRIRTRPQAHMVQDVRNLGRPNRRLVLEETDVLRYVGGVSVRQLARELHVSVGAVRNALTRQGIPLRK